MVSSRGSTDGRTRRSIRRFSSRSTGREIRAVIREWTRRELPENDKPIFLFLNVLGQMEFIYSDGELSKLNGVLSRAFARATREGIYWISVHDRISYPVTKATRSDDIKGIGTEGNLTDEELADRFLTPREIEAHLLGEWRESAVGAHAYLPWKLTAKSIQIAEVISNFSSNV